MTPKNFYFFSVICSLILLTSCLASSQTDEVITVTNNQENATSDVTTLLVDTAEVQPTILSTPTAVIENVEAETPVVTNTSLPLATSTVSLTPTSTSTSVPAIPSIRCDDATGLRNELFPIEITAESHTVVDGSYMYLAEGENIGVFDISEPITPKFLGYRELPDLLRISDITIDDGIAYVTDGSTSLYLLNLSPQCWFAAIAAVDIPPFEFLHFEVEGNKLYVGGALGDQRQVIVYDVTSPSQVQEIGRVEFGKEPTMWSVSEDHLYSLSGDKLFITNITNMDTIQTEPINIELDSEVLSRSWIKLIGDTLYYLSDADGFFITSNLGDVSPITKQNTEQFILAGIFQVQENYVFLGYVGCEGGQIECNSTAYILDAEDGRKLSRIIFDSFGSFGNVYKYHEIQEELLYAFTDDSLIVLDISNLAEPKVVSQVHLLP